MSADGFLWWPVRSQGGAVGWVAQVDPVETERPWLTPTDQKCGEATVEGAAPRIFFKRESELWSINPDGSDPLLISVGVRALYGGGIEGGGIAPQRDKVAFIGADQNLWVVDSSGHSLRRVSDEAFPEDETYYGTVVLLSGWSPDGTKIICFVQSLFGHDAREQERPVSGFYLVDLDTSKKTKLPDWPNFVAWSTDPETVIYQEEGLSTADWYTFNLSTGATSQLTTTPFECFIAALIQQKSLSSDGSRLLYSCVDTGYGTDRSKIVLANIDNTDQLVLLEGTFAELQLPIFSPNGDGFIYRHHIRQPDGGYYVELQLFDLETRQQTLLASGCVQLIEWVDDRSALILEACIFLARVPCMSLT